MKLKTPRELEIWEEARRETTRKIAAKLRRIAAALPLTAGALEHVAKGLEDGDG